MKAQRVPAPQANTKSQGSLFRRVDRHGPKTRTRENNRNQRTNRALRKLGVPVTPFPRFTTATPVPRPYVPSRSKTLSQSTRYLPLYLLNPRATNVEVTPAKVNPTRVPRKIRKARRAANQIPEDPSIEYVLDDSREPELEPPAPRRRIITRKTAPRIGLGRAAKALLTGGQRRVNSSRVFKVYPRKPSLRSHKKAYRKYRGQVRSWVASQLAIIREYSAGPKPREAKPQGSKVKDLEQSGLRITDYWNSCNLLEFMQFQHPQRPQPELWALSPDVSENNH